MSFPPQPKGIVPKSGSRIRAVSASTAARARACAELGARCRRIWPRTFQTNGVVVRFNRRISSEVLGVNIYSHRGMEQAPQGFNTAYNARRQRVLEGKTPNQVAAGRLHAEPKLANPAQLGRAGDTTRARLVVDAAKEASQSHG